MDIIGWLDSRLGQLTAALRELAVAATGLQLAIEAATAQLARLGSPPPARPRPGPTA